MSFLSRTDHDDATAFHDSNIYSQSSHLPKVGQTRCYWTLLSSSLHFLALDPVLTYHLQDQAPLIIGKSLLDFVHPEEHASARHDLRSVLQDHTLHGSVTRVRYSRLSRVRRLLGHNPSPSSPPYPPSFPADRIAYDANYMAVDIVINWAADGLVLCFIHAVVDIMPLEDNDESHKTGWTNWCGTFGFDEDQVQALYDRLSQALSPTHVHLRTNSDATLRVFQILRNSAERQLLLAWPTDPTHSQSHYRMFPSAQTLARLAQDVQIGSTSASGVAQANNNATTSCTRRYKSLQNIPVHAGDNSKLVQVESIFIPHGMIIFACHKIDTSYHTGSTNGNYSANSHHHHNHLTQHELSYSSYGATHTQAQPQQEYIDTSSAAYGLPYLAHQTPSQPYAQQWIEGQSQQQYVHQPGWSQSVSHSETPSPTTSSGAHSRAGSGSAHAPAYQSQWSGQPPPYVDSAPGSSTSSAFMRAQSPSHHTVDAYGSAAVPPPSSAMGMGGSVEGSPTSVSELPSTGVQRHGRRGSPAVTGPGNARDQYGNGGRSSGNPPVGIVRCTSCKATQSPEWRKGPSGKKDLCNACGLRYARSRAKKEGVAPRRRKDNKVTTTPAKEPASATPSVAADDVSNASPTFSQALPHLHRRNDHDDGSSSYLSTSVSSSGSLDGLAAAQHHRHSTPRSLERTPFAGPTPSPSPPGPGGHANFTHSGTGRGQQQQQSQYANSYYGLPSSLSNHGTHHHQQHYAANVFASQPPLSTALPRLESISQFASRVSPILPPASSFERDRDRERVKERDTGKDKDRVHEKERMLPLPLPPTPRSSDFRYASSGKVSIGHESDTRRGKEKDEFTIW